MNRSQNDVGVLHNKSYYLLNERQADIMKPAQECVWVVVSQTAQERQTLDLLLPDVEKTKDKVGSQFLWTFVDKI